jgi:hypothetical protein
MKSFAFAASAMAVCLVVGLSSATSAFAKAHDQGVGDGTALGRDLSDLGDSNTGGSGAFVGGQGGVSAGQKNGARGDLASDAGGDNKRDHGSVSGTVDDAVQQ